MRTSRCAIIVLICILAIAGTIAFAAKEGTSEASGPAAQGPSQTRIASCIVRITADPGILPLDPVMVENLFYSSGVAGKAARDVLGLDPDDALDLEESIEVEWLSGVMEGTNMPPRQSGPAGPGEYGAARMMEGMYGSRLANPYDRRATEAPKEEEKERPVGTDTQSRRDRSSRLSRRSDRSDSGVRPDPMTSEGADEAGGYGGGMMGGMGMSMGGYGAGMGMGGYGAGMGMGGYGAGMGMGGARQMMGYGGRMSGMGNMYGMPMAPPQVPGMQQTTTLRLSVQLPDDVRPMATEFLSALVENLRTTLTDAYEQYAKDLGNLLRFAEVRREEAYAQLEQEGGTSSSPDRRMVEEQLETYVDLSMLSPEMSLAEAIDVLKNSVEPPLQITVMWKDLLENADIEPTTPISMDGLPNVKVRTALEVLLRAVSDPFAAELSYEIKGNVPIIATTDAINMSTETPLHVARQYDEGDVLALAALRRDLARQVQRVEMDLATMGARQDAMAAQIARAQKEMEIGLAEDAVIHELEKLIELNKAQLANVEQMAGAGRASAVDLTKAKENMAKARIELAQRRDERSGILGDRVRQFNSELSLMSVERAEKQAQQDLLRQQMDQVQYELTQASVFDPEAARMRSIKGMIDQVERRIAAMQTRTANLQPPTVTMIGAE